jgi:hypothetical protein
MPVWIVDKHDVDADGRRYRIFIETEHPDQHALAFDLRGGLIPVTHIHAHREGEEMVIHRRSPMLLSGAAIYMVTTPSLPFVEYDNETEQRPPG